MNRVLVYAIGIPAVAIGTVIYALVRVLDALLPERTL